MSGQFIFIAGVLGIGGYVGYTVMNHDPAVFPGSKEQVQTTLANAVTTLPRKDGDGQIKIWSTGRTSKGVSLNLQYHSTAPIARCDAALEAVDAENTKVTIECDDVGASDSAIANTTAMLKVPMFQEHVYSTMRQQPFNRDMVDSKQAGIAMSNMGSMQREALKTADEMQRMSNSR